jgi:hypothetical protein
MDRCEAAMDDELIKGRRDKPFCDAVSVFAGGYNCVLDKVMISGRDLRFSADGCFQTHDWTV